MNFVERRLDKRARIEFEKLYSTYYDLIYSENKWPLDYEEQLARVWMFLKQNSKEFKKALEFSEQHLNSSHLNNLPSKSSHHVRLKNDIEGRSFNLSDALREFRNSFPIYWMLALDLALSYVNPSLRKNEVMVESSTYMIIERGTKWTRKPRNIKFYMPNFVIVKTKISGYDVKFKKIECGRSRKLLSNKDTITYFLADMSDRVGLQMSVRAERNVDHFKVIDLSDKDERWKTVQKRMDEAVKANSDIVVFPEMTICPEIRKKLQDYLRNANTNISLVIAGSFHEISNPIGRPVNKCYVLNNRGLVELEVCKRARSELMGKRKNALSEDIESGDVISLLLTPVGIVNVSICADFNYWDKPVREILDEISADVYLIPSMGDEGNVLSHKNRAAEITGDSSHTTVVVANEHPESIPGKKYKGFIKTSTVRSPIFTNISRRLSVDSKLNVS